MLWSFPANWCFVTVWKSRLWRRRSRCPYATLKQVPEFTSELASKCAHQLIVVSAILNVTGQLEQVTVKQAPDPQVNAALIEALKNWTFQPAQVDGNPVALKILLGIRLPGR